MTISSSSSSQTSPKHDVRAKHIRQALLASLPDAQMRITNTSSQHRFHAGDDGSGETHYALEISSKVFQNQNKLACHRLVMKALDHEFKTGLHALKITILTSPLTSS